MLHQHSDSSLALNLDSGHHLEIDSLISSPFSYSVISAYNNKLAEFPSLITQCKSLKVLNLSCNELKSIPTDIASLCYLEMLDFRA
ncbi:hypothetical protein [Providencia huaxiensis]|uniref:hypothetical protein n=1 Tax=Providencia huaxiensis TaxID=2027290 RepID=UPI0034DD8F1A